MRADANLFGACVVSLGLSLAAALLLTAAPGFFAEHRTLFTLDSWSERTFLWVGLILLAGFVLDRTRPGRDV